MQPLHSRCAVSRTVNENVITNTRNQLNQLRKDKSLLSAALPYFSLLAGYANNINNDAMEAIGIEGFLAKCRIHDKMFQSDAMKLGQSTFVGQSPDVLAHL